MKRISLNKRAAKEIGLKGRAEELRFEDASVFLEDGKPVLMKKEKMFPFLSQEISLPKVIVDMGAVPFIMKGADLMGPGIVSHDDVNKEDLVVIQDENHHKNLAIGVVLTNKIERTGKTIKILHYVGDRYWNAVKEI